MSRLNDIIKGEDELTYKETAEVLKTLLANYCIARTWELNPDEVALYTLAIDKAIEALENAENNETETETETVYDMAHKIGDTYFANTPMNVAGARIYGGYLYIKGYDGGFPQLEEYIKVDLETKEIVKEYGALDCPISIGNGVWQLS